ncbi:MAG TPA: methyltransferase domain-containing protein [Chryseolinea sp.]
MTLREELKQNVSLIPDNGVFYQADLAKQNDFEQMYLSLRQKENRLYTDEIVKSLPNIPADHALGREWKIRRISAGKLISYLKGTPLSGRILEVGCGNGWLANKMASELSADVLALDVNETEILQGARIFSSERLSFVYGDIFSINLNTIRFHCIVLPSSIQYFRNIQPLIKHLLQLLSPRGEIHILDSPLYSSNRAVISAKKRSVEHFTRLGHRDMARFYFHHTMEEIGIFKYKILENPNSIVSVIKRRIFKASHPAFPWIVIKAD